MSQKTHNARMQAIRQKRGRKPLPSKGYISYDDKGRKTTYYFADAQSLTKGSSRDVGKGSARKGKEGTRVGAAIPHNKAEGNGEVSS